MADTPQRLFAFTATRPTFIKVNQEHSKSLPATHKRLVKTGTVLHAREATLLGSYGRVVDIAVDGEPLPIDFQYIFMTDWVRVETRPRPLKDAGTLAAESRPPFDYRPVDVPWMPRTTELSGNLIHYRPGSNLLVVSFDHHGAGKKSATPWAEKFVTEQGWSLLGVTSRASTWFRARDLHEAMAGIADRGLFSLFDRVVFIGASMGGYGASAFSSLCPGATVVATSPQSTLDLRIAPWDGRYGGGSRQDWNGRFADAAAEAAAAGQVIIAYDPQVPEDERHVSRYGTHNLLALPAHYLGHAVVASFLEMKVLKPFMLESIQGTMTRDRFAAIVARRRRALAYYSNLYLHAQRRGRTGFMQRLRGVMPDIEFWSRVPQE